MIECAACGDPTRSNSDICDACWVGDGADFDAICDRFEGLRLEAEALQSKLAAAEAELAEAASFIRELADADSFAVLASAQSMAASFLIRINKRQAAEGQADD